MTTPCIAIHGVGHHEKGHIKARLQETLGKTRLGGSLSVEEFNWDELVEHSGQRPIRDFLWFLEATAESISVSARLGLRDGATPLERALGSLQFHLHRICQWVIALAIGGIVAGTVSPLMMSIPNHLPGLPVDYVGALAWLPGALKLSSITILVLSGSIFALGLLRAVTSLSVRPLSESVRSIFLLYLQPILVILSGVLAIRWTSVTLPVWFLGGSLLLVLVLADYIPSLISGEPFSYAAELRYLAYLFLAAGALVLLQLRFTNVWFGAFLKVMLDIFRYLGDPHYRLRVHHALDEVVQRLRAAHPTPGRFILVAHSLGSVIALDSLLSSRFWRATDELHLITMGSPIRRLFQRFFPSIFFPVSIDQLARRAAGRVRALYWINIFRPFDFIGTALGLSRSEVGVDKSTGQWLRIFSSHSDYWSDGGGSDVHEAIDRALEDLKPASASQADPASSAFLIPSPPTRHVLVERLKGASGPAAIAVTIAMFLGALFWVATSLEIRDLDLAETSRRLQGEGTEVRATVEYDREVRRIEMERVSSKTTIHRFRIRYADPGTGGARQQLFVFDESAVFPRHRHLFDDRRLARHIRSHCSDPWWKFWKWSARGIPCEAANIRFRYLADNADAFDFPDFPATAEARRSIGSWLQTAFASILVAICALFPLGLGGSLVLLLLGHAPFGRPPPQAAPT